MADQESPSGTTYANDAIVHFVDGHYHRKSEAMRLALELLIEERLPRIQISPGDGALLAILLSSIAATRVVEIGTLTGYSALWMLRGLPPDGSIWSCESSARAVAAAHRVMRSARETERVKIVEGPALETLPNLMRHGPFDGDSSDSRASQSANSKPRLRSAES